MFGVDSTELIIVALFALIFIGPKELPQTMRMVGRWVGKARGMARHFTSGIEAVIREAELEEMERKWKEENERIMRDFPTTIEAGSSISSAPAITAEPVSAVEQLGESEDQPVAAFEDQPVIPLQDGTDLPPKKRALRPKQSALPPKKRELP